MVFGGYLDIWTADGNFGMVFGGYLDIWTADGNFGEIDQIIPILGCTRGTPGS